jgi:hypothetical protein
MDTFYPNAASCAELNPADFAISTAHSSVSVSSACPVKCVAYFSGAKSVD